MIRLNFSEVSLRSSHYKQCFTVIVVDPADPTQVTDKTRKLGLVICRGTQVTLICPSSEMLEIANPFADNDDEIPGEEA